MKVIIVLAVVLTYMAACMAFPAADVGETKLAVTPVPTPPTTVAPVPLPQGHAADADREARCFWGGCGYAYPAWGYGGYGWGAPFGRYYWG